MHRLVRYFSIAALVCAPLGFNPAMARSGGDCQQAGLEHLRTSAPDGFAIYKQIREPNFFKGWINCDDAQFDLSTAVHESTHFITSEIDAFPLVGGGAIKRPHEASQFFPPSQIASRFKTDDFVTIYLRRGKASSSTDFLYLLDELNAYSHDLKAAVDLKNLTTVDESVDHRDGLAAMMAFLTVYAETARQNEPATWSGLREPQVARTISELWGRAEGVMSSSCGIPNFGTVDKYYIRKFCAAGPQSALAQIIGRAPVCPAACLETTADAEQASSDVWVAASPFTARSTSRRKLSRQ